MTDKMTRKTNKVPEPAGTARREINESVGNIDWYLDKLRALPSGDADKFASVEHCYNAIKANLEIILTFNNSPNEKTPNDEYFEGRIAKIRDVVKIMSKEDLRKFSTLQAAHYRDYRGIATTYMLKKAVADTEIRRRIREGK